MYISVSGVRSAYICLYRAEVVSISVLLYLHIAAAVYTSWTLLLLYYIVADKIQKIF